MSEFHFEWCLLSFLHSVDFTHTQRNIYTFHITHLVLLVHSPCRRYKTQVSWKYPEFSPVYSLNNKLEIDWHGSEYELLCLTLCLYPAINLTLISIIDDKDWLSQFIQSLSGVCVCVGVGVHVTFPPLLGWFWQMNRGRMDGKVLFFRNVKAKNRRNNIYDR